MTKSIHAVIFTSSLVISGSLASGQAVNGAVNAAANAGAAHAHSLPALPPPPPPPAAQASAAAQGAAHMGGTVAAAVPNAPRVPPASSQAVTHASTNSAVSAGIPSSSVPNVNAKAGGSANASATGQTRGLAIGQTVSQEATVALDTAAMVRTIREAAFAARDTVTAEVGAKLDASTKAVARLQVHVQETGKKSREEFTKALVEVRAHEKALRTSLKATTKAAGESTWGEVQSALAKEYGAYAEAVAKAEATVQGSATGSVEAKP